MHCAHVVGAILSRLRDQRLRGLFDMVGQFIEPVHLRAARTANQRDLARGFRCIEPLQGQRGGAACFRGQCDLGQKGQAEPLRHKAAQGRQ